jgi:hypothetical protein
VAPGPLLGAPVGIFRRHAGVDIGTNLLVAQEIDKVGLRADDAGQALGHDRYLSSNFVPAACRKFTLMKSSQIRI